MALISKKKIPYKINEPLRQFLTKHDKEIAIPLQYSDLASYSGAITLYDHKGEDTLWLSVIYSQSDQEYIYNSLKKIYAILKVNGDLSIIKHLYIDRIDVCTYGNTRPFRVRVVNQINDNFDYFYIKVADASRVYGLELEDNISPNRVSYLVYKETLIEEHILGIPADQFIKEYLLPKKEVNKRRLAKEFIKFNERCLVRLLGDMHSSNFVVDIMPDFDEIHYRLRAIDFDQQSYEKRRAVYCPQYFKQNNPILDLGFQILTPESVKQYQREERVLIANRAKAARHKLKDILETMCADNIAPPDHEYELKYELASFYKDDSFVKCVNMGDILKNSLNLLFRNL